MTEAHWAAAAAGFTSVALALRALMLGPRYPAWCDAPRAVRGAILFSGAVFGGLAVDLARSPSANLRECVAYTTTALSACALLINMWRQRERVDPPERTEPCST